MAKVKGFCRYNQGHLLVDSELIKRELSWVGLTYIGGPFKVGCRD